MKRVVIEFEESLHKKIKMQALQQDVSIKQYVTDLIISDLKAETDDKKILTEKG